MSIDIKYIKVIRNILKNNIISGFNGHQRTERQVLNILNRIIQFGKSDSVLLIGPRGCGKTSIVNHVLKELRTARVFLENTIVVELNGLIHINDRYAIKSITAQLNLENVVEGKVFGTYSENLTFLLDSLHRGDKKTSKGIIFILEEFDLFCMHHNQSLLYNLFEVSQSAQTPVCILGITNRLDVTELFEKRVKSRFSHRQIYVLFDDDNQVSSLEYVLQKVKYYLTVPENVIPNVQVQNVWNTNLEKMIINKRFKSVIQSLINVDNSERYLKTFLMKIVFNMKGLLSVDLFEREMSKTEKDDRIQILQDLTILEMCLIIAMKHHSEIYDNQPMNFEMVLTRYLKFVTANSNIQTVQRSVIMKAFENIESLELIHMLNASATKLLKEYQFFKLLVTSRQISEAVKKSVGLPTEIVQWANNSVT